MPAAEALDKSEPIQGYRTTKRIGAGGYGEVWSAEAPGGLLKAIKFVYGYLDEDRAARELKALNRVKSVRHPFLLSLERIEVVAGQLLIVTELADGSLKDRFDECVRAGLVGIPRDELIGYLRDAAEALDYMSESYSLQHLDVKPENLLLLAGRIKVADFGLVKDIHDRTVSLMGGLTPLYAPPEVFDGRPSRRSDQYSLAIVFQEMLTGALPFPGKTAAQLAVQHLNAKPQLSALSESDQQAIAKALSKDPKQRFGNCAAMIDALCGKAPAAQAASPRRSGDTPNAQVTEAFSADKDAEPGFFCGAEAGGDAADAKPQQGDAPNVNSTCAPGPSVLRVPHTLETLPPIEVESAAPSIRPTLFIAIGGLASKSLVRLRRRFYDRYGRMNKIPALQMLALDTDAKALAEVTYCEEDICFSPHESIALPLRRTQDYRGESRKHLQWLSRRWIYNIPRSLQTEGLRPLGRLALIDHAPQVLARIKQSLTKAVDQEAREKSAQATGLKVLEKDARIVIVASISGGTGGGMVLDLAYAARKTLADVGYDDKEVYGVLLHGCGRNPTAKELATVNAYSCLRELYHYSRPGGAYPGDSSCGMPSRREDNRAFRSAYFAHLGEDLSDEDFEGAADQVAQYLFLDTATSGSEFLDQCRKREPAPPEDQPDVKLRSFSLVQLSCAQEALVATAAQKLSRKIVEYWTEGDDALGDGAGQMDAEVARKTSEKAAELGLDASELVTHLHGLAAVEMEGRPDQFFTKLINDTLVRLAPDSPLPPEEHAAAAIDNALGWRIVDDGVKKSGRNSIASALEGKASKNAADKGVQLRDWILSLADVPQIRVAGARKASERFMKLLESIEKQLEKLAEETRNEVNNAELSLGILPPGADDASRRARKRPPRKPTADLAPALVKYAQLRLYEFMLSSAARMSQTVRNHLASASTQLLEFRRDLNHFASEFGEPQDRAAAGPDSGVDEQFLTAVEERLHGKLGALAQGLDRQLQNDLLAPHGGLRSAVSQGSDQRNKLLAAVSTASRNEIVRALHDIDVTELVLPVEEEEAQSAARLKEILHMAQPRAKGCGGGKRLLLMLPQGSTDTRVIRMLHEHFHETPSVVVNCDGDLVLCYEVENISLPQAAAKLIEGRPDFADFAARLQTRNDVNWSSFPALM